LKIFSLRNRDVLGCEKYEDMGAVVKFTCPYVFVHAEQKWFRLTGGHPSEQLSNMTVRLFEYFTFAMLLTEQTALSC
jgi:hypothetical protein